MFQTETSKLDPLTAVENKIYTYRLYLILYFIVIKNYVYLIYE